MEKIRISIVIPTYKRPLLLARCLSAIISQTLIKSAYEIIIVSDGPDEISAKIARELLDGNCRYQYLSLPEKKGPAAARNLGWKNAVGNLIAFTDDDCLPDTNWLNSFLSSYNNERLIAFTGAVVVPAQYPLTDFARNTANLETAEFITANCCIARAALELTGGFDERFLMAWREDSDLEFKLITNNIPVKKIHTALVVHPVRGADWGVSLKEQRKGMFNALLYKKFPVLYRSKIQSSPAWDYYVIVLCVIFLSAGIFRNEINFIIPPLVIWTFLITRFISRRLKGTSHKAEHVIEMILTSLAIPFLSVYWQLYGSIKYRVLFI